MIAGIHTQIRKTTVLTILVLYVLNLWATPPESIVAKGQQPQMSIDLSGTIRIIYGDDFKIYCATSIDNGATFPDIQLVGEVPDMHLGMSRGPQVASSKNFTLVSAIDKGGVIHIFQLNHKSGKWTEKANANDVTGSAPEGLMSLSADANDTFYAVWLDIREDKSNKICFTSTTDQGTTWAKNKIVYKSPDRTVCECCKPNISASQSSVNIMFRNWLGGSRDLYILQSVDKGITFSAPVKLGNGTWKLKGCPMDGGGLTMDSKNNISTVWQREGVIYYATLNTEERQIGTGRNCSIASPDKPIMTWQDGEKLKAKELSTGKVTDIGIGSFVKAIRTKDSKILYTWERDGKITFRKI